MSLDVSKLELLRHLDGGRIRARCPACAEHGGDNHGERHLLIEADGRFGCCANPGDKNHRQRIHQLAGNPTVGVPRATQRTLAPVHVMQTPIATQNGDFSVKAALTAPFSDGSDGCFQVTRGKEVVSQKCTRTGKQASEASETFQDPGDGLGRLRPDWWAVGKYPPGEFDAVLFDWNGRDQPHVGGWLRGKPIYLETRLQRRERFNRPPWRN